MKIINTIKWLSLSTAMFNFSVFADDDKAKLWPYEQDTPIAQKLSIGMASDRPVDISRFLLARGPYAAHTNSKASHLAYLDNVTGVGQLWVKDLATGTVQQLTFGNGVNGYAWHPDGQHLLYSADNEGDEREAYFLMSLDGSKESVILSHSDAYRVLGDFTADGKRFSYASTERNGRDFDIYLYDFERKASTLIYQSEFGFYPASWQPNSDNLLVREVRGEDAFNLHLLDSTTGKLTTLHQPEVAATFDSISWKQDGSGFYVSSDLHDDMIQILYHDMKSGRADVVHTSKYNLENVSLCYQDQYLTWVENNNGFDTLFVQELAGKSIKKITLPEGVYRVNCDTSSLEMVVEVSSFNSPNTVYLVNAKTGDSQKALTPQLAGINPDELIKPDVITFKARDGVTVQGLLYMPTQSSNQLPPIVFNVHGGPTAQAKPQWKALAQYLVGKGIAVLDINVRGSTGFGKTYARLDNQEKRLDSVRDLVDALAFLKEDGRVNTERAGVMGGSYGGYMVNAVMGLYPEAFKAGASFVGVSNWVRALETASPGLKASDLIEYGDIREPKWQTFYAENSPINTVHKIKAPMFFEHGVNDPRDPVTESDDMVHALRKRDIPVTYLRFPDEGHSIAKLENRVVFYRELAKYLETHL